MCNYFHQFFLQRPNFSYLNLWRYWRAISGYLFKNTKQKNQSITEPIYCAEQVRLTQHFRNYDCLKLLTRWTRSCCKSKHGYSTCCSVSHPSVELMWGLLWRKGHLTTADGRHVQSVHPFVLSAWFSGVVIQMLHPRRTAQQRRWPSGSDIVNVWLTSSLHSSYKLLFDSVCLKKYFTLFTHQSLGQCHCTRESKILKTFVGSEEAAQNLMKCIKWCNFSKLWMELMIAILKMRKL